MNICCGGGLQPEDLSKLPYENVVVKIKDKSKPEKKKGNKDEDEEEEDEEDEDKKEKILEEYIFNHTKGIYEFKNSKSENEKNLEIEKLKKTLEKKEKEKSDYEKKIRDLDLKLENMEKILLMDIKENQYINLIGVKTQENRENNKE